MSQRLLFIFAVLFSVSVLSAYNLYVDASANPQGADGSVIHPYPSIQEAIDHALDDNLHINQDGPAVVINLFSNTQGYNEALSLVYYSLNGNLHFVQDITIKSISNKPGLCVLEIPQGSDYGIQVSGTQTSKLKIQGITIEKEPENEFCCGIMLIKDPDTINPPINAMHSLHVDNCIFNEVTRAIETWQFYTINSFSVTNSIFNYDEIPENNNCFAMVPYFGGSIATIKDNAVNIESYNINTVGISYVTISMFDRVEFINNLFKNAIVAIGRSDEAIVHGNRFIDSPFRIGGETEIDCRSNIFVSSEEYTNNALTITEDTSELVEIAYNQFYNCSTPIYFDQYDGDYGLRNLNNNIFKNSFINCDRILNIRLGWTPYNYPPISSFRDNLYVGSSSDLFYITDEFYVPYPLTLDSRIPVFYCHFENVLTNTGSLLLDSNSISYGDPYIRVFSTNYDYELLWDCSMKSPCINAGCPEINGEIQLDADGTPSDIGAKYYVHAHKEYDFNRVGSSGIHWRSFPVVDDRSQTDGHYWNEAGMFFNQYMINTPDDHRLESAAWSYGGDAGNMAYFNYLWTYLNYPISQPKGFKIQFRDTNQGMIPPLLVDGFKADPNQTPIELTRIDANNVDFPNWIGYFVSHTQSVENAFSKPVPGDPRHTYLDYIYSISTQGWNTSRIENKMGMEWIIPPHRLTLSEGDMVEVKLIRETPLELEEMTWFAFGPSREPYVRLKPEGFIYTELMDYIPIFIEFDPENTPEEVGIFVGDKCYGAAVVDDGIIEVNLYYQPEDEAKNPDDELSFMFYYADKSVKKAPAPLIYNPESLLFETGILKAGQIKNYGYVSYFKGEGSSMVPLLTQLNTNYPNPFRENTKITYILEKESNVTVDIYNLKGQKIKTLYTGFSNKGKHGLSWDATDKHGKKVASGVYFCRLSSPQDIQTQKMLLMK